MQSRLLERLIKRTLKNTFRRAERQIKPHMEPGENLLSYDMCQEGAHLLEIYTVRRPATFVVVSTKAVYLFQRGRDSRRISAYAIADVQVEGPPNPLVTIRLRGDHVIGLLAHGNKPAAFGPDLKALVRQRPRATATIPLMSCECNTGLTVQLHDGGTRYPVIPVAQHDEISYWFDARCTTCGARYEEPFARVDESGKVLADQREGLPIDDLAWLSRQCGPFTCGCDEESLHAGTLPDEAR